MEDIVPKTPDLKDMISIEEAAKLEGYSFEDIQDLIARGKLSSHEFEGSRLLDRKEVERLKKETDLLQEEISDNS
jgi:excisionase family DNA binding protein